MRGRWIAAGAIVLMSLGLVVPVASATAGPSPEGTTDWLKLSTGLGGSHVCGIRTTHELYCWGTDAYDVLGNGPGQTDQTTPLEVGGTSRTWKAVSTGFAHTCAITVDGHLFCWGWDFYGQLGDGPGSTNQNVPTEVSGAEGDWASVSAGQYHTCARKTTGHLFCWGRDSQGAVGDDGSPTDRFVPTEVAGGLSTWASVSAGYDFTCARRTDRRVLCWGNDAQDQVGDGPTLGSKYTPVLVAGGITDWTSVSAGGAHACARRATGRIYCWGKDGSGRLGDGGANTNRNAPTPVAGGITDWASVSAGYDHTCARRATGRLYCWGEDGVGAVGDGAGGTDRTSPREVSGASTNWSGTFVASNNVSCARRTDKRLYCWGFGGLFMLGNASTSNRFAPVEVSS